MAAALCAALALPAAERTMACAFHGYTPNPTLVDLLLITEQVVLARPSPDTPARYRPVETLLGPTVTEIGIPVDPAARARLSANPSETVLMVRDGSYGPWLEILVLDPRHRALVQQVMARQSAWMYGNDADRAPFFAARLNDASPGVRRLALQELDRVPYAELRRLDLPPLAGLRADIDTGEADLRPIRILLAGLSGDASFLPLLSEGLDRALAQDVPHAGAYATALIELGGAEAVRDLAARHLAAPGLAAPARDRLLQALAIQYKAGPPRIRAAIAAELARLLRAKPQWSALVADQFGFAGRGRLTPEN